MPVEIRELVIRVVTTMDKEAGEVPSGAEGLRPPSDINDSTEAIIQECIRQVLRILRKEKER
jgi:hypothetical protein